MLSRLLPLLLAAALAGAETYDERVAATDAKDAQAVFELAGWCKQQRMHTRAQQHYKQVIAIDPDHQGAREALGFVRVGDRWRSRASAPAGAGAPAAEPTPPAQLRPATPGPTAAQIVWDLSLPTDPEPANSFITKYVERLATVPNESTEMEISVATCVEPKYWRSALPRLCKALQRDDFTDLYGAANMVLELAKRKRMDEARPLLGFMVKASERVTEADDLDAFCWAVGELRDRRAVPRLIELMERGPAPVARAAATAIASIARVPAQDLTAEKARLWWDLNHSVSEREGLRAQLSSPDGGAALEAARALYQQRDKEMIPTAIRLLKHDDPRIRSGARDLIVKVTGDGWGFDPAGPPEQRAKIVERLEAWWTKDGQRFQFADAASVASAAGDPLAELVMKLDSTEGNATDEAAAQLRQRGDEAIPALLAGLSHPGSIVRRRCDELLKEHTRQDMGFDARGSQEQRDAAVAKWKAWWAQRQPAPAAADKPAEKPAEPAKPPRPDFLP